MLKLMHVEFYKLRHSVGLRVLMLISLILVLFGLLSVFDAEQKMTGYETFFKQLPDFRTIMFVFAGALTGIMMGEDFSSRAFQASISSGHSRLKVLLSKVFVYWIGLLFLLIFQFGIISIIVSSVNGFGDGSFLDILKALSMYYLHIVASSMLCVLLAFVLKNKGSIMGVNMLLLVLLDAGMQIGGSFSKPLLKLYMQTPWVHMLTSSSLEIGQTKLLLSITLGVIFTLVIGIWTYVIFKRSELK